MNPYQAPTTATGEAAGTDGAAALRWTALFAIVTGLILLVGSLAAVYQFEMYFASAMPDAESQRAMNETIAALKMHTLQGCALYGTIILAGAFLLRRKRWASYTMALACLVLIARLSWSAMNGPASTILYSVPLAVWLAFLLYRAWKAQRELAFRATKPPSP
jgi:hypothetical protein